MRRITRAALAAASAAVVCLTTMGATAAPTTGPPAPPGPQRAAPPGGPPPSPPAAQQSAPAAQQTPPAGQQTPPAARQMRPPPRPSAPVNPPCPPARLRPVLLDTEGAAGSVYLTIGYRNIGQRSCWVRGYPTVAFVDRDGRQIGGFATRTDGPAQPVTIAPGRQATFVVRYVQAGIQQGCDQPGTYRPASGLRISPPGVWHPMVVPLADAQACSWPWVRQLSVGPLTR
ncbi:MAG: DUF4232 domain-containing protein [Frankia sp.]|nr:DUF4232 domain-containing protein [Frankia sp.]